MQALESILKLLLGPIYTVIECLIKFIQQVGSVFIILGKFDGTLDNVESLFNVIFPQDILSAFMQILLFYVGFRIIRFLTLQG